MRGTAYIFGPQRIVTGCPEDNGTGRTVSIEHVAWRTRGQFADVERARAEQAQFLAGGEQYNDVGTGRTVLDDRTHRFEDGCDARLVVGRQDGGAGGADNVALYNGDDALARLDRIHMRRKHDAPRNGSRQARDQVARIRTRSRARIVEAHLESEIGEFTLAACSHRRFAARRTFDTHEFKEQTEQPVRVHTAFLPIDAERRSPARNRADAEPPP